VPKDVPAAVQKILDATTSLHLSCIEGNFIPGLCGDTYKLKCSDPAELRKAEYKKQITDPLAKYRDKMTVAWAAALQSELPGKFPAVKSALEGIALIANPGGPYTTFEGFSKFREGVESDCTAETELVKNAFTKLGADWDAMLKKLGEAKNAVGS
jgi:hypothetical protein